MQAKLNNFFSMETNSQTRGGYEKDRGINGKTSQDMHKILLNK